MIPRQASRNVRISVILIVAVIFGLVAPALAEGTVDDLRSEREGNRRDAADAAAQLDTLSAQDQELLDAIADLDAQIALQESKISAAERAIADAEALAAKYQTEAESFDLGLVELKARLRESAIDAYVRPSSTAMSQLNNSDLMEEAIRRSFLDDIAGNTLQLVDELRATESKKLSASKAALASAAEAETRRASLAARLTEIGAARVEQEDLRTEVQKRIDDWESEAADLEQANFDIGDEIRRIEAEAEAERKAAEEAARQAAEEAAEEAARAAEEAATETGSTTTSVPESTSSTQPPSPDGDFLITHRPVPGAIMSPFGARTHPIFGSIRFHYGLDLDGDTGDAIAAAADGVVISARWMNGYGNAVVISHGGGFTTLYAHQSQLMVSVGDAVVGGQTIGLVGSTGWSSGPHLHFEVRVGGVATDPVPYFP